MSTKLNCIYFHAKHTIAIDLFAEQIVRCVSCVRVRVPCVCAWQDASIRYTRCNCWWLWGAVAVVLHINTKFIGIYYHLSKTIKHPQHTNAAHLNFARNSIFPTFTTCFDRKFLRPTPNRISHARHTSSFIGVHPIRTNGFPGTKMVE